MGFRNAEVIPLTNHPNDDFIEVSEDVFMSVLRRVEDEIEILEEKSSLINLYSLLPSRWREYATLRFRTPLFGYILEDGSRSFIRSFMYDNFMSNHESIIRSWFPTVKVN